MIDDLLSVAMSIIFLARMFERFFKKKEKPAQDVKMVAAPEEKSSTPEDQSSLSRLTESIGWIPDEVHVLYSHSRELDNDAPARLMSIAEVLQTNADLIAAGYVLAGPVSWFWTDDNSNYCGVYMSGPLKGWLTRLNHDEPRLIPAYRSVSSFLTYLAEPNDACDLSTLAAELPLTSSDVAHADIDKRLSAHFRALYETEQDEDQKRHFAFCSICLTPVEDTGDVLHFFEDEDMWTPAAAVELLELRRYEGGIAELEKLAREGGLNGDSAAMRHLVRLGIEPAKQAVSRLRQDLTGQKLKFLEMLERGRPL